MEFPGITVGGGYAGTSGESSLFKHGFFNKTINWVDIVLADGEIVRASPTENSDLFEGAAGAAGTLGIVVSLEVRLIEAKRFVKTTYKRVESVQEAAGELLELTERGEVDDVDGLLFSLDLGLVITGNMIDEETGGSIFSDATEEDSGWETPSSNISSYPPTDSLANSSTTTYTLELYMDAFTQAVSQTHMWCKTSRCLTLLRTSSLSMQKRNLGTTRCGYVHYVKIPFRRFILTTSLSTRMLSSRRIWVWKTCSTLGGMKWLYANTYYTENNFSEIHDGEWYKGLREKYRATTLPKVWQKVHTDVEKEAKAIMGNWFLWLLCFWPLGGSVLPLGLLTAAQGHPMLVELKNGETLNGHLVTCDTWMNLTLKEVVQTSPDGDKFFRLPEVYVKGNNIKYLRVPDEIIDVVKEQQQRDQGGGYRGGRGGQRSDYGGRGGDRGRGGRGGGRGRGRGGRGN
ncbi:hypothetical protein DL98DRAFT_652989 [Cadophora sp. DSE1049]|nr:hypothetical protein DL98DRAFT_652989 [Cadophora sp. DSE1049]